MKVIEKFGHFFVAPAQMKPFKKYDVYSLNGDYITSFGQIRETGKPFTQYRDLIGVYKKYDNNDPNQRDRYRRRHLKDKLNDPKSAGFWAFHFLW
jgi:hypothetical protein